MSHDAPLYPVALSVGGRRCLVVGGGPIATRKVEGLLRCRADVVVVAPDIVDPLRLLARHTAEEPGAGSLVLHERRYEPGEAGGYRLVVTATGDPEVDHTVAGDADAAGVWVNSADDVANCTFLLPAIHRSGDVTVAVSTGGASPALAGWLRDQVAAAIGDEAGILAALLSQARRWVQAEGRSTETVDWSAILSGPVTDLVRAGRIDDARQLLRTSIEASSST